MREKYLKSIGALVHISIDFKYESDSHRERKEEKNPYKKGERVCHIRNLALLREMLSEELMKRMTVNRGS
jgi:hypothetical protein